MATRVVCAVDGLAEAATGRCLLGVSSVQAIVIAQGAATREPVFVWQEGKRTQNKFLSLRVLGWSSKDLNCVGAVTWGTRCAEPVFDNFEARWNLRESLSCYIEP